jgi:hypothetical protein
MWLPMRGEAREQAETIQVTTPLRQSILARVPERGEDENDGQISTKWRTFVQKLLNH